MVGTQLRRRQRYEALKAKLWTDRASSIALWQELSDYIKPTRYRVTVTDRNRNDNRNQFIIDNTATLAQDTLESGLHAVMSSQARPWFTLAPPYPQLGQSDAVKSYLYDVKQRMLAVLNLSNFYNSVPEVYGDVSTFGTGAMACFYDTEDLVRFYTYPLGSYAVGLNKRREVCTFILEEQYTVRQLIDEFGQMSASGELLNPENFSQLVRDAWKAGRFEDAIDCCWVVMPNDYADASKLDAKYLPYTSCWFEVGRHEGRTQHEGVLRESGFRTFPVMVPRWKTTGNSSYGTNCPGMMMRGDVKQLQGMEKKANHWLAKLLDPPLKGSQKLKNQPTSLVAGHITYDDPRDQAGSIQPIHEVRGEGFQHFEAKMDQVRERINRAAYFDLFRIFASNPYGQPMTAEEVKERHAEKLLILGPALERMNEELLEKVIDRVFDIMADAGLLPEPPEELQGVTLKVEFTSVLAEAQKLTRVVGTDRFVSSILPMAEAAPEVLDKIDFMELVDEYHESLGASPKLVRPTEAAMARVQARAEAQQQAVAAEQAQQLSMAAKNVGQTPMGQDSALDRMLETVGAA